jgi:DNA-binding PadR family transcriptional regulator
MKLTPAQRLALEWLPADGAWRMSPGRLASALSSLSLQHRGVVEDAAGNFGPRGGFKWRYRLTDLGQKLRARLEQKP